MRELVARYLRHSISRRDFLKSLTATGVSLAAAESVLSALVPVAHAQEAGGGAARGIKVFEGSGGACMAEQFIASGVKYVFGNSSSEDAQFYEALVDRPQLKRAAKLLVEARLPLLIVGDELYHTKSVAKAVRLAELLGMPVAQARQMFANFPTGHPLWVGNLPVARINSLSFPKEPDVVINVGNKLQHQSPALMVGRNVKFIDLRIDSWSMGNVMATDVPLVADVAYRPACPCHGVW